MDTFYYLDKQNQRHGPVDQSELSKHRINSNTLMWKQGMSTWLPAGYIEELAGLFPPPPPCIVPPPIVPAGNSANETLIYSGSANHFLNGEGVGGKMYLYAQKLVFKSHGLNIQTHELTIELSQINNISFCNSLGFIPNGLEVKIKSGATEKFVVNNRQTWKSEINRLRNAR